MPDALLTSLSALNTHQRAMEVTAHNIANATTPGYSRQRADVTTQSPEDIRPGQMGRGITLDGIRRMADDLLAARLRGAEGESGRLETLKNNLLVVQQSFNEPGDNGLSAVMGRMFDALQDLSNNPESVAIRSTAVQQLSTFTGTLRDLGTRINDLGTDLRVNLESGLKRVNELAGSIAQLNQQIRAQVNLGNSPNDLLDRRETQLQELTRFVGAKVRIDPTDQSAQVDVAGTSLVSGTSSNTFSAQLNGSTLTIVDRSGLGVDITGGSIGALMELNAGLIPGIAADLDDLSRTLARQLNQQHAVATSNSLQITSWTSGHALDETTAGLNLDDARQVRSDASQPGIPAGFLADFTDSHGALTTRNLTINVLDTASKLARKYTIQFDPARGNGSRTIDDLVQAINTGVGGAFSLYPAGENGIPGVTARKVQIDGGYRLELSASDPQSTIDFASALDLKPTATAWRSGTLSLTSTAASVPVALRGSRASIEITGATTARVTSRDPSNGQVNVLGTFDPTVGGSVAGLTIAAIASPVVGDRVALSFDQLGNVLDPTTSAPGSATVNRSWVASDAGVAIRGRYTNTLSDPSRPWTMRVLTAGVIGNRQSQTAPNNPPTVQFTVWTGTPDAPVQQVITRTLDDTLASGRPVQLVDGVYAVFDAGSLSAVGSNLAFTVDGQPDQAGLLTALGINQLLVDPDHAASLAVADAVEADPSRLAMANSRNEGDNSRLKAMLDTRKQPLFRNQSFAVDDFYHGVLTDIGVRIQQAERLSENQDAVKASLDHQREQISGVNIDDEVGKLILQQQAYSAAARVVNTARENIQTLLEILR